VAKKPVSGWLFKEEPDCYSFADLERDGSTSWGGVTNNLARQNLRKVQRGDSVLFYHTGKEKAVVGEMRVVEGPSRDPASDDPKAVLVKVEVRKRWRQPVSLATIKADPSFAGWDLIRLPRLSVVPVSAAQWQRLEEISEAGAGGA
jgi:predicted RNA-binding protein with PUA-like domain